MRLCDFATLRLLACTILMLAAACATKPPAPPLVPPDAVSAAVLEGLCGRLRIDAIASPTAPLAVVSETRPLATQQSMSALAMTARGRIRTNRIAASAVEANRAVPVQVQNGQCTWRAVAPAQLDRHHHEMVVELSAPAINPYAQKEAGVFARVAVGGEGASWYWISLHPYGDQWAVGNVSVLVQ
ncbi:MAG TPA: hypothetical protein VF266_28010 [Thermoanaerobaculia bacterium]